jgi:Tol biopolymer transport system component
LAFPTTSGIFKIKPNGDSLIQLTYGQDHDSPSWSHLGGMVFFAINAGDEHGIWSINPTGGDLRRWNDPEIVALVQPFCFPESDTLTVFSYEKDEFCLALYAPGDSGIAALISCEFNWPATAKILPDKSRVLLIAHSDPGLIDIFSIVRSSGSVERVTSSMSDRGDLGFDFSPDGRYVVYPAYLETGGLTVLDLSDYSTSDLTPGREVEY